MVGRSVTQEGAPYKVQCTCSCGFCCRDSVARSTCACNCQLNCTMRRMRCDTVTSRHTCVGPDAAEAGTTRQSRTIIPFLTSQCERGFRPWCCW
jgi:hypothetical protein